MDAVLLVPAIDQSDWAQWCALNPDFEENASYLEFLEEQRSLCDGASSMGIGVERINVNSIDFIEWCRERNTHINSESRKLYLNYRHAINNSD